MQIKGSKIIVTGGSLGIGKETAKQLIEQGAEVVITGRNVERLEQAAEEIGAKFLTFDVSDLASIPTKAKACIELLGGKVDLLINNAGIGGRFSLLGELTQEDFEQVFNTNVFGLALLTQEIVPIMKAAQKGTIINVGSTASLKSFARGTVYSASKFALRAMTQSWQAELRRDNIRVGLICPSEVTTAFNTADRSERTLVDNKLDARDIAHSIISMVTMADKGFIPELTVWATNPF